MLGKFFECEADKTNKYYKLIYTEKKYENQTQFVFDKIIESNRKIDFNADIQSKIGGFYISSYEYIFRWIIRGDTLCEVKIPDGEKIYKTISENGIYVANKIILTNPQKIDDNFAMKLYLDSTLPETSYFKAMIACAICGYMNTAIKVCENKVNKDNINTAIYECEEFCKRRKSENFITNENAIQRVNFLFKKLKSYKE